MKKVGTKELYEMILTEMDTSLFRGVYDAMKPQIPDDLKPEFEAISAIVKEFSEKLGTVTMEELKIFSAEKLNINFDQLSKIKDEFLNNLRTKFKDNKEFKAMTIEFIKVINAAKKNSDSQKAAADAAMPEDIKNVLDMFLKFNLEFVPSPPDAEYTQEKAEEAASKVNVELTRLIEIRNQIVKDETSKYRKYADFMKELSNFSKIIKKVNANKEPEQSDEEKDLEQKLQLFQRFIKELESKGKTLSESSGSNTFVQNDPFDEFFGSGNEDDEGDEKLTKDDLETAASAIGTNLDELKKIAQKLQAADSILQTLPPEKTEELRNILTSFNKAVRETRSQEDVFDEIVSNYEKAVAEKVEELGKGSPAAQAYLEKSKTVMSAFKKAFQEKDDKLDPEVEEEIKETLSFDRELKLLKLLMTDVMSAALGSDIQNDPPGLVTESVTPILERPSAGALASSAFGALAGAGGGWLAGLSAMLTGGLVVAGLGLGVAHHFYEKNKDNERLKKQIPKSLEYGINSFIKTVYKAFNVEDDQRYQTEEETQRIIQSRYKDILDDQGQLKLTQIDITKTYEIYQDILKQAAFESKKDATAEAENPLNGSIEDTTSELGAALEKLANIIKVGNRTTNESRETSAEDSKALYDFLKMKGRDHKQMLRKNFNEKEIKGLQLYFSNKTNTQEFIQKYFNPTSLARAKMAVFGASMQDAISETKTLEEALKPIIRSVIKEIL